MKKLIPWLLLAALVCGLLALGWNAVPTDPLVPLSAAALSVRTEGRSGDAASEPSDTPEQETTEPTEEESTQGEVPTESTEPSDATEPTETAPPPTGSGTEAETQHAADGAPSEQNGASETTEGTAQDTGHGDGGTEGGGPVDDAQPYIVTDLSSGVITYGMLEDDVLPFYAYLVNGTPEMYLRVKVQNSRTPQNGRYLTAEGRDYRCTLAREERNLFTIYIKRGEDTVGQVSYAIRYLADKADESRPTVGENPPTVVTNLDGWTEKLTNRNFTFTVRARDFENHPIPASNLQVQLDGRTVTNPTGSDVLEYELYFRDPVVGDDEEHTVTVLAWDGRGNSTFKTYTVTYHFVDTGDVIGTAYLILDATVVGLAPEDLGEPFAYEIKQNEPASFAVLAMLDYLGYEATYLRTPEDGFYLQRISKGGMADYAAVPENLWNKILADGLGQTGQHFRDSLGEFDYTQGSGWMYSVGGTVYAGKGLSNYYLSDGDTLYLRFSLAYGKDIGGYESSGGSFGVLPTYCGRWINGTYISAHRWSEEERVEPTCTKDGMVRQTCRVCGDQNTVSVLPALGHDYQPTQTAGEWRCSRCGDLYYEPTEPPTEESSNEPPTESTEEPSEEPTENTTEEPTESSSEEPTEGSSEEGEETP